MIFKSISLLIAPFLDKLIDHVFSPFCSTRSRHHWISDDALSVGAKITAKTRYRQQDQPCEIVRLDNDEIEIRFDEPQRAVTPGQALVFYDGRVCLGGATIFNSV